MACKNTFTIRLVLFCTFLSFFTSSFSQIEEQILAYQDSSRMIINNGRELLIDKIADYDFEGANEVYFYLQEKALVKRQLAFTYSEIIYINLITGNYRELLDYCKNYKEKSFLKVFSSERSLTTDLKQQLMEQYIDIKNDLEHTDLNDEQLALVKIILHVIEVDKVATDYTTMINAFKENYPQSEYQLFINSFLPSAPLKISFAWDFGTTVVSPTSKLGDAFNTTAMFGMALDLNVKKVYSSFYMTAGDFKGKESYVIENTNLRPDDNYSYFDGGVKLGYFLIRDDRFHIAPYTSISGTTLRTNIYGEDDYDLELDLNNCFSYGIGLHSQINLFSFSAPYYYGYYGFYAGSNTMVNQHFALKLDMGYNVHTQSGYPQFTGNTYYARISFIWGIGIF